MLSDVIVALATPPGRSALAVVRLSGDEAFRVTRRVIPDFRADPPRQAALGTFQDASGDRIDKGIYVAYRGPESYTGEDVVEVSCHGGATVPMRLIAALEDAGARMALPGEFTRRAVLNGKMDLIQAEAVGDLIDATAPAQARAALSQLDGGLSERLAELRKNLVGLAALLSYDIDFPEEDDSPVPRTSLEQHLQDVAEEIDHLVRTAPAGERVREGAVVVMAGRPNVGKSSLFNALLGVDRAIVTEVPGTTRDAIEAGSVFLGWPVRLVDTAGLRVDAEPVERLGIEISHRYLQAADVVLLCVEAGRELAPDELALLSDELPRGGSAVLVRTKADLTESPGDGLPVSSLTAQGLDLLRRAVAERVFGERLLLVDLEPMLTRERHRRALAGALNDLSDARPLLTESGDPVLAAHHVQQAIHGLDALIGAVDVEDVLDRIFSSFCVGK